MKNYRMLKKIYRNNNVNNGIEGYYICNKDDFFYITSDELKKKIKNKSIYVQNLQYIQSTNALREIHDNVQLQEREIFYECLMEAIGCNGYNLSIPMVVLEKLNSVVDRKYFFQENKTFCEELVLILKSFFNYMQDSKFTIFDGKHHNRLIFKDKKYRYFNTILDNFNVELCNITQDEGIKYWKKYGEVSPVSYICFTSIISKLLNNYSGNTDVKFSKISFCIKTLKNLLNNISLTFTGWYMYYEYTLNLMHRCFEALNCNTALNIRMLNNSDTIRILKESTKLTNDAVSNFNQKLNNYCNDLNNYIETNNDKVKEIFTGLSLHKNLTNQELKDLDKKFKNKVLEKYNRIKNIHDLVRKEYNIKRDDFKFGKFISNLNEVVEAADNCSKLQVAAKVIEHITSNVNNKLKMKFNDKMIDVLKQYNLTAISDRETLLYFTEYYLYCTLKEKDRRTIFFNSHPALVPLLEGFTKKVNYTGVPFVNNTSDGRVIFDTTVINEYENKSVKAHYSWIISLYMLNEEYVSNYIIRKEFKTIYYRTFEESFYILTSYSNNRNLLDWQDILKSDYGWHIKDNSVLDLNIKRLLK